MRKTRPKMAARGTGPKSRLSCDSLRLSPRTKYCFVPRRVEGNGAVAMSSAFCSVDEDASAATDHRVTGDADHTLGEVEVACVWVRCDRAADLTSCVNDHDLAPVWVAKVVRKTFGKIAAVTCRDRWRIARALATHGRHDQARRLKHNGNNNKRDNGRDRYPDHLPARTPSGHLPASSAFTRRAVDVARPRSVRLRRDRRAARV